MCWTEPLLGLFYLIRHWCVMSSKLSVLALMPLQFAGSFEQGVKYSKKDDFISVAIKQSFVFRDRFSYRKYWLPQL